MSYSDQLNNMQDFANDIKELRSEEISQDIHNVLNDGTVFGELIANSIGEAVATAIDKSGLDTAVTQAVSDLKSVVSEAANNAIKSPEFSQELGSKVADMQTDRDFQNDNAKEMGS